MTPEQIETNTSRFLQTIPQAVEVVAAAKTRTIEEVQAAVRGGIKIIGSINVNISPYSLVFKRRF